MAINHFPEPAMHSVINSRCPADVNSSRFLRQVLLGAAFLGVVAVISLPAARGAGPIGWMPLWLLGMPLCALGTLALRNRSRQLGSAT